MAVGSGWVLPPTPLLFRAFFTEWGREVCSCQPPCLRHGHMAMAELRHLLWVHCLCCCLCLFLIHCAWAPASSAHTPGAKFILASHCKGAASCHFSGGIGNGRMLYKTQKTQSIPRGRRCTIPVRQVYETAWKCWFWAFFALLFWEELVGGGYISMVVN